MKEKKQLSMADLLNAVIKWVQPELKELFPEPGSFNGLMLLWPPLWFKIIKLKLSKK